MIAAARDVLALLGNVGARVDREGDKLVLRAGAQPVPASVVALLRERKAEILDLLSPPDAEDLQAAFDERAGIIEDGAGVPREWAEGFARLDLAKPPPGYPAADWRQLIDDAGRFLDDWAAQAAALGWRAVDVFGIDPKAPVTRYDRCGLVPILRGHRVVAVTASTAVIETPSGARQTFRRETVAEGGVAVWDIDC